MMALFYYNKKLRNSGDKNYPDFKIMLPGKVAIIYSGMLF